MAWVFIIGGLILVAVLFLRYVNKSNNEWSEWQETRWKSLTSIPEHELTDTQRLELEELKLRDGNPHYTWDG